jgi:DNA-directed RNA polymerase specialized sigma24 family protein
MHPRSAAARKARLRFQDTGLTSGSVTITEDSRAPASSCQAERRPAFVTTRWSVVLSARDKNSARSAAALETLCRTYWYPLYAFVRRQGHSPHDAQDLTQEFFARLLQKNYLEAVAREKGRFRSFLLVALKRFLANEWDKSRAQKRGGARSQLPLDTNLAEQRYAGEAHEALSADLIYERRWALTILDRAMTRLHQAYTAQGKEKEFDLLKPCLTADRGEIPYARLAAALHASDGAARLAVHRLRKRFRELFREEISRTVAGPEEIQDEVRHLLKALAG